MSGDIFQARQDSQVLQQAEIMAMRAIGDNVAAQTKALEALTHTVVSLGVSLTDVRERVIRIEAQEATTKVKDLEADLEKVCLDLGGKITTEASRISTLERALARYQGMVIPAAIAASAVLASFGRVFAEKLM